MFFNKLNSQKTDDEDKDYNNTYKPLAGDDRYTLPSRSLHDAIQYEDKSQEPPYKNKSKKSPADKEQYLIEKNIIKDLFYNSNNSDIIMLRPAAINIHCIKKAKKDLRHNKQITKLIIKAIKAAEASAAYIITHILQRQSLIFITKNHNITFKQIYKKPIIYKKTIYFINTTL